jgi:2',3'-cyclic-nucleotide 2'-phosphodiesterase (5'-nucleotidase family)
MKRTSMKKALLIINLWIFLVLACAGSGSFKSAYNVNNVESQEVTIDSTLARDPAMNELISPYRAELNKEMSVVIGYAAVDLKKGRPEAALNNFVADLMLKRANQEFDQPVQVALTNLGGLRVEIPRGPITREKIFEVMPFENELVVLDMTGAQLITLAKEIGASGGEAIAGMRLEYSGDRLARMTVRDHFVESDSVYHLVTTDFLSSPGRNKFAILSTVPRSFLGVMLRDAILDEIIELNANGKQATAEVDGRVVIK